MTVAVCLHCGALKHGAYTRCPACGALPDDEDSRARHLLATDHFLSREALDDLASRVRSGEPIHFDPDALRAARVDPELSKRIERRLLVGCVSTLLIVIALAVAAIVRGLR